VAKRQYDLLVPVRGSEGEEYILRERDGNDQLAVPVEDVMPAISITLQIRMELFAERVVAELLDELRSKVDLANQRLS
jgi:hypothetical protein